MKDTLLDCIKKKETNTITIPINGAPSNFILYLYFNVNYDLKTTRLVNKQKGSKRFRLTTLSMNLKHLQVSR